MSSSFGERSCRAIDDPRERKAIALLSQAGWSHSELAMTFMIGEDAVMRLLEDEEVAGDE